MQPGAICDNFANDFLTTLNRTYRILILIRSKILLQISQKYVPSQTMKVRINLILLQPKSPSCRCGSSAINVAQVRKMWLLWDKCEESNAPLNPSCDVGGRVETENRYWRKILVKKSFDESWVIWYFQRFHFKVDRPLRHILPIHTGYKTSQ